MRVLLPLPVVLPLLAAALSLAVSRWPAVQRVVGLSAISGSLAASVWLVTETRDDSTAAVDMGGWPAPSGITLVADTFAAMLLVVSFSVLLAVLIYVIGRGGPKERGLIFHPVYLVLAAGVSLAYLTGDLFNLFVAIEVVLVASYVLITVVTDDRQVRPAMTYIVINLLASTLLVAAVALVYAATGTVNLADLSIGLRDLSPELRSALGVLLLLVFGIKAGIFPLFFWLPDSYPTAPTPVTAIFAGLLTKVGVYAVIRTQTLLFPTSEPSTALLVVAGLTMTVGVLGALAQEDIKRILSFHIISQVGYMIMGLALFTVAGIAGAIFYMVHHIPVKTGLFLAGGLVEQRTGTSALGAMGGLVGRSRLIAILFALPALSIAGIPPMSGFVAKLSLVQAGIDADEPVIVAVSLLVSLLTLMSMVKIWTGAFWGDPPLTAAQEQPVPRVMSGATAMVVCVILAIGFGAGPVWNLASDAATTISDTGNYTEAVFGR